MTMAIPSLSMLNTLALLLLIGIPVSLGGASELDGFGLLNDARKIEDWIITVRRELHQHPELMFQVRGSFFIH